MLFVHDPTEITNFLFFYISNNTNLDSKSNLADESFDDSSTPHIISIKFPVISHLSVRQKEVKL